MARFSTGQRDQDIHSAVIQRPPSLEYCVGGGPPFLSRTEYCLGGEPPPSSTVWVVGPIPRIGLGNVLVVGPPPSVGLGTVWVVCPFPRVLCGWWAPSLEQDWALFGWWAPSLSRTGYCVGGEPPPLSTVWAPSLSRTGYCLGGGPPPSVGLGTAQVVGPFHRVVSPLPQQDWAPFGQWAPLLLDIYWILTTLELSRHFVLQCTCV